MSPLSPSGSRARAVVAAIVAATLLAAGCGADDDDADAANASTSTSAATAVDEPIEVVATDYGFEGLPATVPAGTTLSLHNTSMSEAHELVAFDLPPDEERTAAEIFQLPEDELMVYFRGDPNLVLVAPPGEDSIVGMGDGTLTRPARYLVFCAVPTGADPAEYVRQVAQGTQTQPQVDGGPPHYAHGMYAELTVQ